MYSLRSFVEDILEGLIEFIEWVYTKSRSGGGAKPGKNVINQVQILK